jgi:glycerate 2-kinase
MGGLLDAPGVAEAIATGWRRARPDDDLHLVPMSDGGEGLLNVLRRPDDRILEVEVAGPDSRPVQASFLLRTDGTAVVESAAACGLHLLTQDRRNPLHTTTYGVGQLLDAARIAGATRILVGLGGSATVDGGAGALIGLGLRLRVNDGSGLKIGGDDLHRIAAIGRGWIDPAWDELPVVLLADVRTKLQDAARVFGPQKGATPDAVRHLETGLSAWADVVERDLATAGLRGAGRHRGGWRTGVWPAGRAPCGPGPGCRRGGPRTAPGGADLWQ